MKDTKKKPGVLYGMSEGESEFQKQFLQRSTVEVVKEPPTLAKSILNLLGSNDPIHKIAFSSDPVSNISNVGLYHAKHKLIPDSVAKRIAIQDSLVSAIVRVRSDHVKSFGRPRPDMFSKGYILKPRDGVVDRLDEEGKEKLQRKIEKCLKLLSTCGKTKDVASPCQKTFSEFLSVFTRSGVTVGRGAVEIIPQTEEQTNEKSFAYFCAVDGGTIYRATTGEGHNHEQAAIRKQAYELLCRLEGSKLEPEKFENNSYAWVQVVEGRAIQAFTAEEMKVHNFYPVADIEMDGYPVTPIDTCISAITTHLNIVTSSKVYFESGRATRGMLVIKSDDVTQEEIHSIKQQFNAGINGASAAWRMPCFGIPAEGDIKWMPLDNGGTRDMEFQYLSDMNARDILTAFSMSPDELPGYGYLSKGTTQQGLSESNNEYKLEATRDIGIRPLLQSIEDFVNREIIPLLDEEVAELCLFRLMGLDAITATQQAVELDAASKIYLTYDDVMQKTEKSPVGKEFCGAIPLSQAYQGLLDKYRTVGWIMEHMMGIEGASKDPKYDYLRDAFYFQKCQMDMAKEQQAQQTQLAQQAQQQQAQAAQAAQQTPPDGPLPEDDGGGTPSEGGGAPGEDKEEAPEEEKPRKPGAPGSGPHEFMRAVDQAYSLMQKSETTLPEDKKAILRKQKKAVNYFLEGFEKDTSSAVEEILKMASELQPKD